VIAISIWRGLALFTRFVLPSCIAVAGAHASCGTYVLLSHNSQESFCRSVEPGEIGNFTTQGTSCVLLWGEIGPLFVVYFLAFLGLTSAIGAALLGLHRWQGRSRATARHRRRGFAGDAQFGGVLRRTAMVTTTGDHKGIVARTSISKWKALAARIAFTALLSSLLGYVLISLTLAPVMDPGELLPTVILAPAEAPTMFAIPTAGAVVAYLVLAGGMTVLLRVARRLVTQEAWPRASTVALAIGAGRALAAPRFHLNVVALLPCACRRLGRVFENGRQRCANPATFQSTRSWPAVSRWGFW
jgi:hypothetical protein